jgi:hypothetical protein
MAGGRRSLMATGDLAHYTGKAGAPAGARKQSAALLPVAERALGPEHPTTRLVRSNLAYWTGKANRRRNVK